ncbi:hypothetical protein [Flavihumibacter sp. UBA7668]|uniref:hypothetical protein n=1 Tax=Flavihumibacter sp. UBA7668 TaxID=1946542 RepID=UPI0025B8D8DF|nr:hypothetical protein [Flavihumibacter sp. UBA7668]
MLLPPSIQRWMAIIGLAIMLLPLYLSVDHMIRQHAVKIKMQTALKGTELTTVLLQPQELRWLKPGKEIWLNESFFDVLAIDSSSLPWKVRGLYDPEDTKLHMKLIRLLHKQDKQEDQALVSIAGWLSVWCSLPQWFDFNLPSEISGNNPSSIYTCVLLAGIHETSAPPPWIAGLV